MTEQKLLEKLTGVNNPRFITPREDAIIKECLTIINELEAAISVTRCCEELKDKKAMTLKDYAKINGYTRVCKGAFLKDNKMTYRKELHKQFKDYLQCL